MTDWTEKDGVFTLRLRGNSVAIVMREHDQIGDYFSAVISVGKKTPWRAKSRFPDPETAKSAVEEILSLLQPKELKMEHFNKLTPAEAERLAFLQEEMNEAGHIICKILRHGYESHDPTDWPVNQTTNRHMLERELGDVICAIELMSDWKGAGDLQKALISDAATKKTNRVKRWMHHQKPTKEPDK